MIGALALVLNLAGNGGVGLWDRDEPRYAVCVREMRARNDWIFPTYNAEPRYHKPILIYWLMRLGVAIGGDNPFGMRLVSGFAGAGTCLLVWGLGRRMFGPQVGRLAALVLATAPIMLIESKLATTDATLAFWFVGGQFCLWELSQRPSRRVAAVFWLLLALGILTKGPVPAALLAASGLVSWWWGGPTACWKRLEWRRGLILLAVVTLPWFVAIGIVSRGDFYRVAVGFHIIQRVTSGIEEHGGFPGYYVVLSLLTFYPWSALLPAALYGGWSRRRSDPAFGFLLGWIVGPLIFLELVRTKLIHYYLPAYPACALLVAWLVVTLIREEVTLRRWPLGRLGLGLLNSIGIGDRRRAGRGGLRGAGAGPLALPRAGRGAGGRDPLGGHSGSTAGRPIAAVTLADRHLGGHGPRDRDLAAPRARALPDGAARRRAAGDHLRPAQARARAADVPGAEHHLRLRPPGARPSRSGRTSTSSSGGTAR